MLDLRLHIRDISFKWLLQIPKKVEKILDVENAYQGFESDKKMNLFNGSCFKNPPNPGYVSEQTHTTEHYGSPVRLDTWNSSCPLPQPTLERPVESRRQTP